MNRAGLDKAKKGTGWGKKRLGMKFLMALICREMLVTAFEISKEQLRFELGEKEKKKTARRENNQSIH